MTAPLDFEVEGRIRALATIGWSSRKISGHLLESGIKVSHTTVIKVIKNEGKRRQSRVNGQIFKRRGNRRKLTKSKVKELNRLCSQPNPMTQEKMAKKLGVHQSSISRAISRDLGKSKRMKLRLHCLTSENKQNRKTNARKLYDTMQMDQLEFMVTLDESVMCLVKDNNKTRHCYLKRGQQLPDNCLIESKEGYPKTQMVVGGMTGRGPLPLIKIPNNVKINAKNYCQLVLKPYFDIYLPKLYPNEMCKILFHHDKASSHTAIFTQAYLTNLKSKYGINFLAKQDIPVKGPDISPLDFFGFGFLKQKAKKCKATTLDGLWRFWQKTWSGIDAQKCLQVFRSWKRRLREVSRRDGGHIEHLKNIHKRKITSEQ